MIFLCRPFLFSPLGKLEISLSLINDIIEEKPISFLLDGDSGGLGWDGEVGGGCGGG